MKPSLTAAAVLVAASLGLVPSASVASAASVAVKTPKAPVSGTWKLTSFNPAVSLLTGSLVVAPAHKNVRGTKVKLGAGTPAPCGTGTVKVLGTQKITLGRGVNEGGAFKLWAVGTVSDAPAAFDDVKGAKVVLSRAGKQFAGTLSMAFNQPRGGVSDGGQIAFKGVGGTCQLQFIATK
jgi:hypothetical protein